MGSAHQIVSAGDPHHASQEETILGAHGLYLLASTEELAVLDEGYAKMRARS